MRVSQHELKQLLSIIQKLEVSALDGTCLEAVNQDVEYERLLNDAKSAVDNIRTSIWCCLVAKAQQESISVQQLIERHRMKRIVEMLRSSGERRNPEPHFMSGVMGELHRIATEAFDATPHSAN
jgi:hypothetical protein